MNKDSIKSLVNRSLDLLREMHYSDFCINRYEATWRCGICKYMEDNGYEFYDSTIGNEYLQILSRSEEHTSELQSRDSISYAVFCLKKKKV